jgi:hypothetical protein
MNFKSILQIHFFRVNLQENDWVSTESYQSRKPINIWQVKGFFLFLHPISAMDSAFNRPSWG